MTTIWIRYINLNLKEFSVIKYYLFTTIIHLVVFRRVSNVSK